MIIDVMQSSADMKNTFNIYKNGNLEMVANTPFLDIKGIFNLENLRQTQVFDLNNNLIYRTDYKYVSSQLEELIPFKYLFSGSQKFSQYSIIDRNNTICGDIFFEQTGLTKNCIIVKTQGLVLQCFCVDKGKINHICIYNGEVQIGEILKPNIVINGLDSYRLVLKDEYSNLSDILINLILYVDRLSYNSSYIINRSTNINYTYNYSPFNKYYHPEWVNNNFNMGDYYKIIDNNYAMVKSKIWKRVKLILILIIISFIIIGLLVYFLA